MKTGYFIEAATLSSLGLALLLSWPAPAAATTEGEGGAGSTSGQVESDTSEYTVDESTPATGSDAGGAGTTSGSETGGGVAVPGSEIGNETPAEGGVFSGSPTPVPSPSPDMGGAGETTGSGAGSGAVGANQVRGTIDSVDSTRRRVTIRDDQGNLVSYDLNAGGNVKVGEQDSSLAALSNGDAVIITLSENDPTTATEVKVETGQ